MSFLKCVICYNPLIIMGTLPDGMPKTCCKTCGNQSFFYQKREKINKPEVIYRQ